MFVSFSQSPQEIALEKIRNLEVSMRTINTQVNKYRISSVWHSNDLLIWLISKMQRFMEQIIERMNEEDADLAGLKTDLLNREKSCMFSVSFRYIIFSIDMM